MMDRVQLVNLETLRFVLEPQTILLLYQVDLLIFLTFVGLRVPSLEISPGCGINRDCKQWLKLS